MTPTISTYARLALVLIVPAWLMAVPAEAQRRNPQSGERSDTPREGAAAPAAAPKAVPRGSEPRPSPGTSGSTDRGRTSNPDSGDAERSRGSAGARPRGDRPAIGRAEPRTEPPSTGGGGTVIISSGYGGYGYGGYGYGYGGYGYGYPDPGPYYSSGGYYDEGKLRLKLKPTAAAVYVDGYYAGIVDDYDGIFQRLRLEAGPHRIEIQEPGYEPLTVDVRIDPGRTTTYRGSLTKLP